MNYLIQGMTSEGGGAVAFPVMTLALNISPAVARDFSLMIQSVGMTAATFTIFWMRIKLEWRSIIFCSTGAVLGMIIGLEFIDPNLTPPQKKMGFVSIWFAFAFALFLLNRYHKRKTFKIIPAFNTWKIGALLLTGFLGGVFSAFAGSGADICTFSILTLLFRVSEKIATPTSVVVMAGNTVVGFYWRQVMMQAVHINAFYYLAVCAPIVVLGAPLGSVIGSHFHRQVLAYLIYILDTVALISAFVIVKLNGTLMAVSFGIIFFGFTFFGFLSYLGHRFMRSITEDDENRAKDAVPGDTGARINDAYVITEEKENLEDNEREAAEIIVENEKLKEKESNCEITNTYCTTTSM